MFGIGTGAKLDVPLAEWDHVSLAAAQSWAEGLDHPWLFDHPPLYPAYLTLLFKFFGPGTMVARVGNIGCVLIAGFVLFRLTALTFSLDAAFWAVLIYLTNPICIQGVSSLDMADTSLLPLFFLLTARALKKLISTPTLGKTCMLGMWFAICMWAKITSTIAWMAGISAGFILLYLVGRREGLHRIGVCLVLSVTVGLTLYLLSSMLVLTTLWGPTAFWWPLKAAYAAVLDRYAEPGASRAISVFYSAARIVGWSSPYLLLIFALALWSSFVRRQADDKRFVVWIGSAAAAYFLVHMVIGGTNWGFPRYHVAILPVVCMMMGIYLAGSAEAWCTIDRLRVGAAVAVAVLANGFLAGDPLFFLSIEVKQMLLNHSEWQVMIVRALGLILTFYGLPLLVAFFVISSSGRRWHAGMLVMALVVGLFATTFTLDAKQLAASYRTSVQYGASGKEALIRILRVRLSNYDRVLATPEFIYELRDRNVPDVSWDELRSKERFYRFVRTWAPAAIISGLTVSTLDQLRWMLGPETRTFLVKNYQSYQIGTYFLWLRVDTAKQPASEGERKGPGLRKIASGFHRGNTLPGFF